MINTRKLINILRNVVIVGSASLALVTGLETKELSREARYQQSLALVSKISRLNGGDIEESYDFLDGNGAIIPREQSQEFLDMVGINYKLEGIDEGIAIIPFPSNFLGKSGIEVISFSRGKSYWGLHNSWKIDVDLLSKYVRAKENKIYNIIFDKKRQAGYKISG
jgi:hypothetical protein